MTILIPQSFQNWPNLNMCFGMGNNAYYWMGGNARAGIRLFALLVRIIYRYTDGKKQGVQ
jgi:hypothetical protein